MSEFYDPIKRRDFVLFLRGELEKAKCQTERLKGIAERHQLSLDISESRSVVERLEAKVEEYEAVFVTIH